MPEHGYLCAAALGCIQQNIEPSAAHGVAVAVGQKCLVRPQSYELVSLLAVIVSVAVAGNAAHGEQWKFFAQSLRVAHTVTEMDDLVGLIFRDGVFHAAGKAVSVRKNGDLHNLPPVRIKL